VNRVLIIGGGISGLATAFHLTKTAEKSGLLVEVIVLERDPVPGGKMRTTREDGFTVEWGPNGFLTNKPDTLEMVRELGIENRLAKSSDEARKRYLLLGGKLHRLPESPVEFLRSPILSPLGKLRVMMEPFIPPKKSDNDETLADFVKRRLGTEALEKLIEPMASGIYAGRPEDMSLISCFPTIHQLEMEHGGLIRGMLAKARERKAKGENALSAGPGGVLTSFDGGVLTLIEETAGRTPAEISTSFECARVEKTEKGTYRVSGLTGGSEIEYECDAVVVSTPAYAASSMLTELDAELSKLLSSIPYAPISVVAAAFDEKGAKDKVDGFGYLVPRAEKRKVLGVLFDSSIFPNRAPNGKVLLRGMIGGARNPEYALLPEKKVVDFFLEEIRETLGIKAEPHRVWFFRHEKGIPQYNRDHQSKLKAIDERLSNLPGLFLNSNAYRGIGLNDCVRNGRLTAERIIEFLTEQRR